MKLRIPTPARLRRPKEPETAVQVQTDGGARPDASGARQGAASATPGATPAPGTPAAKPDAGSPAAKRKPSEDPHERLDGLRAWLAQVDRKVGVRTYAGGAAVVLALAAGIVGVVLALSAKDESATKAEVEALREEIGTI